MRDYAKIWNLSDFGLEVLNQIQIEDTQEKRGYSVMIHIINIRLNPVALNAYIGSTCKNSRDCYETKEEYFDHVKEMDIRMELWEKTLIEHLGIKVREEDGISVTQNVSEFFTVVYMENLKEYGRKK
ncbi:MAG: hypothetical protein K2H89_10895 [Oscillospiraceae bacterium]|nr:hypothetical protein [Oscillospiraceae bacterium]